jgi:hypothetical protein
MRRESGLAVTSLLDRAVAGINAIAFTRNFPPACQKTRQNCVICPSGGFLERAVESYF